MSGRLLLKSEKCNIPSYSICSGIVERKSGMLVIETDIPLFCKGTILAFIGDRSM